MRSLSFFIFLQVEEKFNIPVVRLVNDFVAAGYGLLTLDVESECITLQVL